MKYIRKFNTSTEFEAAQSTLDLPNVSIIKTIMTVSYFPYVEKRIVAKFNVTSTSNPTQIKSQYANGFSEIEIDGVVQSSVVNEYVFSTTGEHTVKYTLADPTTVCGNAFSGCTSLISIVIPNGVTKIDTWAFQNNSGLISMTIPEGVARFEYGSLEGCSGLTSLVIPSTVTYFGGSSLKGCSSLTSLTILATTPPSTLGTDALTNTNNCPIYVPSESVSAYKSANKWSNYSSRIQAIQE